MTDARSAVGTFLDDNGHGVGLAAATLGVMLVAWMAIDGPLWKRSLGGEGESRARSAGYYKASLLQVKACYAGPGGDECSAVHSPEVFVAPRWFGVFRYALLASLFMIIVGVAAWITNRISPQPSFPDPNARKAMFLFSEILGVSVPLPFLLPEGWGVGLGYVAFMIGVVAVIIGTLMMQRAPATEAVALQPLPPEEGQQPGEAQPAASPPPQASAPAAASDESEAEQSSACVRCGGSTVFLEQFGRYQCTKCELYQPPRSTASARP